MKTQRVTIHRPATALDGYGNKVLTGTYSDHRAEALWVGPVRSTEYTQGRQTLVVGARAAFVPGTDVEETDEVTALGQRWRVVGLIRQNNPTNPEKEWHVTCDLERAE